MAVSNASSREELNAEAARLGIADADKLANKDEVLAAIEANEAYQAEQAAAKSDASQAVAPQMEEPQAVARFDETVEGGRYEIRGKIVDANGQPVTGKE